MYIINCNSVNRFFSTTFFCFSFFPTTHGGCKLFLLADIKSWRLSGFEGIICLSFWGLTLALTCCIRDLVLLLHLYIDNISCNVAYLWIQIVGAQSVAWFSFIFLKKFCPTPVNFRLKRAKELFKFWSGVSPNLFKISVQSTTERKQLS